GVVKDPAGAVIPGARVTVRNEETGASQVTTTDSRGHYSFSNVQAGNSALFVSSPGFKRYDLSNLNWASAVQMRSMRPWRLDRPPKLLRFRPAQQTCLRSPPRLWVSLVSSPPRPRASSKTRPATIPIRG